MILEINRFVDPIVKLLGDSFSWLSELTVGSIFVRLILVIAHSHTIKGLLTHIDKSRTFLDPLLNCSMSYFRAVDNKNNNCELIIDKVNINPNN